MRHACFTSARALAFVLSCCAAVGALAPSPAAAGPVEQLIQVAMHPGDPDTILLRYKFGGEGLFVTHDGGESWSLVCNSFIDPSTAARNGVAAVGGDGALFLGVFDGLWQADDGGCGWELTEGVGKRWVADVAADPEDQDVLYAVTANGGEGKTNGILRREAGDSWSELGEHEEGLMIFRMRVVSTGSGLRFVQGATRGMSPRTIEGVETMVPNYVIRVSDDGESFQEFPFEAPDDGSFLLAAVDPSNPDRIVAYVDRDDSGGKADPVLVSLDGGQSFETWLEVTDFGGIAITPEGRVYVADRGSLMPDTPKGLWVADSLEDEPSELFTDRAIGCLGYQAATETLFACELRAFGTLDQTSGAFTKLMEFDEVQSMVECEGVDMAEACRVQLCRDYCLLGHFPNTPLCEVYQSPTCGPCSNEPPGPGCMMEEAGSGGSAGSAAGSGGAGSSGGAAGSSAGGGPPEPGAGAGGDDGGDDQDDDDDDGDGGCAIARPGSTNGASAFGVLGLLGLAALTRARRRRLH